MSARPRRYRYAEGVALAVPSQSFVIDWYAEEDRNRFPKLPPRMRGQAAILRLAAIERPTETDRASRVTG